MTVIYNKGVSPASNVYTVVYTVGELFTTDGVNVYSSAGNVKVSVIPGIYLVRVDGRTIKLMVK